MTAKSTVGAKLWAIARLFREADYRRNGFDNRHEVLPIPAPIR
jgi:hypothetical protein